MNLVALLICIYLRANPDRDSTHSSSQNVQNGRVTIYRGGGPFGMDQGRVCCWGFFESGSFEIAKEGAVRSGVALGGAGGAALQLPCKPFLPYNYLQWGARTIKEDPEWVVLNTPELSSGFFCLSDATEVLDELVGSRVKEDRGFNLWAPGLPLNESSTVWRGNNEWLQITLFWAPCASQLDWHVAELNQSADSWDWFLHNCYSQRNLKTDWIVEQNTEKTQ